MDWSSGCPGIIRCQTRMTSHDCLYFSRKSLFPSSCAYVHVVVEYAGRLMASPEINKRKAPTLRAWNGVDCRMVTHVFDSCIFAPIPCQRMTSVWAMTRDWKDRRGVSANSDFNRPMRTLDHGLLFDDHEVPLSTHAVSQNRTPREGVGICITNTPPWNNVDVSILSEG